MYQPCFFGTRTVCDVCDFMHDTVITKASLLCSSGYWIGSIKRKKMLSNQTTKTMMAFSGIQTIRSKALIPTASVNATIKNHPTNKSRMEACPFCPANVDPASKDEHILTDHANFCFKCKKCMNKHFRGSYGPLFTTYQVSKKICSVKCSKQNCLQTLRMHYHLSFELNIQQGLRKHYYESHGRPLGEELDGDDGVAPDSAHSLECNLCHRSFLCQSTRPLSLHLSHDHADDVAGGSKPRMDSRSALAHFAKMSCRLCDFSTTEVGAWMTHFTRASMGRTFCLRDKLSSKAYHEAVNDSTPTTTTKEISKRDASSRRSRSRSSDRSSRSTSTSSSRSTRTRSSRSRSRSSRTSTSRSGRGRRRYSRSSSASLDSCRTHETEYDYDRGITVKRKIYGFARQPSKRRRRQSRRRRTRSRSSSSSSHQRRSRRRQSPPQLTSCSGDVQLSKDAGFLLKVKAARKNTSPGGQRDFK